MKIKIEPGQVRQKDLGDHQSGGSVPYLVIAPDWLFSERWITQDLRGSLSSVNFLDIENDHIIKTQTVNVVTCAFCGEEYKMGTPTHGAEALTEHIKICEKHPMRKIIEERDKLRRMLIDLIPSEED